MNNVKYKVLGRILDGNEVVGYRLIQFNELTGQTATMDKAFNAYKKEVWAEAKLGNIENVKAVGKGHENGDFSISGTNGFKLSELPSMNMNSNKNNCKNITEYIEVLYSLGDPSGTGGLSAKSAVSIAESIIDLSKEDGVSESDKKTLIAYAKIYELFERLQAFMKNYKVPEVEFNTANDVFARFIHECGITKEHMDSLDYIMKSLLNNKVAKIKEAIKDKLKITKASYHCDYTGVCAILKSLTEFKKLLIDVSLIGGLYKKSGLGSPLIETAAIIGYVVRNNSEVVIKVERLPVLSDSPDCVINWNPGEVICLSREELVRYILKNNSTKLANAETYRVRMGKKTPAAACDISNITYEVLSKYHIAPIKNETEPNSIIKLNASSFVDSDTLNRYFFTVEKKRAYNNQRKMTYAGNKKYAWKNMSQAELDEEAAKINLEYCEKKKEARELRKRELI